MEYIKEHNIKIFNARGVYSVPMSEFAISGVLQLYKKSLFFLNNKAQKQWIKNREIIYNFVLNHFFYCLNIN